MQRKVVWGLRRRPTEYYKTSLYQRWDLRWRLVLCIVDLFIRYSSKIVVTNLPQTLKFSWVKKYQWCSERYNALEGNSFVASTFPVHIWDINSTALVVGRTKIQNQRLVHHCHIAARVQRLEDKQVQHLFSFKPSFSRDLDATNQVLNPVGIAIG